MNVELMKYVHFAGVCCETRERSRTLAACLDTLCSAYLQQVMNHS